jgi:cyclopropane fatty-acyl-phospholipid synthase-like methyltransferase
MNYYLASRALKAVSATETTRRLYRLAGNMKRDYLRTDSPIDWKYFFRTGGFLDFVSKTVSLEDGMSVLEMGTGWVHWESLILRNCVDCDIVLYDVWDNRSFRKFQSYARQLSDPNVRHRLGLSDSRRELMERVAASASIEEAYAILGFNYHLDPTGSLAGLPEKRFDFLMSSDVGEHLPAGNLEEILARTFDVLKPGGWAYHQIVLADHLTIYAPSAHPKEYLRFDKSYYNTALLSGIQYINLLQIPEWLELFEQAGFETFAMKRSGMSDISALDVHSSWRHLSSEDLGCTIVQFLLRRPDS